MWGSNSVEVEGGGGGGGGGVWGSPMGRQAHIF